MLGLLVSPVTEGRRAESLFFGQLFSCLNRPACISKEQLYSTPWLCELVVVTDRTIRRWISRGWTAPLRVQLGETRRFNCRETHFDGNRWYRNGSKG